MDADGPRLCLVLDLGASAVSPDAVADVLQALDAATLILGPVDGQALDMASAEAIVKAAQESGIAVLLQSDVDGAKRLGTDGVHLAWRKDVMAAFEAVRQAMGPDRIVGADVGRSRHDAMEIGEAGADYVAFGIPAHVEDRATAIERQLELVGWWSEVFEVPVIAFDADGADHVEALARAGADFIAVRWPDGEARPVGWAQGLRSSLKAIA